MTTRRPFLDPELALERGVRALERHQSADHWEGEVVWCPMLVSQYAMAMHIMGEPLPAGRRDKILLGFRRTQLDGGLWGMSPHSEPYLFVTTLVYVAARTLGVDRDDELLAPARRFIAAEGGVLAIPSWGKFWLAMMGCYGWQGVNPILPEAWALPRKVPLHPSNFYCHTRLIYMGMAALFGAKLTAPRTTLIDELRRELYPGRRYDDIDFASARDLLRDEDLYAAPTPQLRGLYAASVAYEKVHSRRVRRRLLDSLRERIRWELHTTDHTSISPVSGLLNILTLWSSDPDDADARRGIEKLEGWIWEDDVDGTRVTGARSGIWDTGFALQALNAAAPHLDVRDTIERGAQWLDSQQIRETFDGHREAYRIDPKGGFPFAELWHGWPVSDCTAEAIEALMGAPGYEADPRHMQDAVRFILRTQNPEGGFGSYEAKKSRIELEWMNPAEMFGDSMTEMSYVECCASCIMALSAYRENYPATPATRELDEQIRAALERAGDWLANEQNADGTWDGNWGVHYIYGTRFGIKGMLAAGVAPEHPRVRRACRWLLDRQKSDGSWGEHHSGCVTGVYREHDEGQCTQTAWALDALLSAEEPNFATLERAALWLARAQDESGEWPAQDMTGVFFHTALLDYVLYRAYFPVWALGLYESRRKAEATDLRRGEAPTERAEGEPGLRLVGS